MGSIINQRQRPIAFVGSKAFHVQKSITIIKKNSAVLGNIPFIQVLQEDNVTEKDENGIYQISASRFFG